MIQARRSQPAAMTILIQFIHPYPERSRANHAVLDALRDLPGARVNDLYALYPNFYIDIQREQALLMEADVVLFQHPFYWYGCPALLKEWIDVVLEQDFAYGAKGLALRGKRWLHSVTTGMPATAYAPDGINGIAVADLLKPFELTARFCGMTWLEPMVFHGAYAADEAQMARHGRALRRRLETLA